MLSKVLDLLIAVTFVYAVESIFTMFNSKAGDGIINLEFRFLSGGLDSEKFWYYFVPALALILHVVQVAQYHQKRIDWKIETLINKKLEGLGELIQITAVTIPVVCLILVSRFIPYKAHKEYIIYLWMITYFCYSCGDWITLRHIKNEEGHKIFKNAVKNEFWAALVMFFLCLSVIILSLKIGLMLISIGILLCTLLLFILCSDFLFHERPIENHLLIKSVDPEAGILIIGHWSVPKISNLRVRKRIIMPLNRR